VLSVVARSPLPLSIIVRAAFFLCDGILVINRFAYYAFQLSKIDFEGKTRKTLLAAPTSLFGGCVRVRQGI
jgi:hypothetical protein